jgi:hypothetical protein
MDRDDAGERGEGRSLVSRNLHLETVVRRLVRRQDLAAVRPDLILDRRLRRAQLAAERLLLAVGQRRGSVRVGNSDRVARELHDNRRLTGGEIDELDRLARRRLGRRGPCGACGRNGDKRGSNSDERQDPGCPGRPPPRPVGCPTRLCFKTSPLPFDLR